MEFIIVSENITLKPIEESNAQDIFNLIDSQREYFGKWLPFVEYTKTVEDDIEYIRTVLSAPEEARDMIFCIYFDNAFVGLIGLKFSGDDKANGKVEIGYWLSEKYQGRGIITKSAKSLIDFAFNELRLNRVQILCAVGNTRSINIPKRLGFTFEGIMRDGELLSGGKFTNLEVYSILKKEWH